MKNYHEELNGQLWVYFVSVMGTVVVCIIPWVQGNIAFDRTFSFTAIFLVLCISSAGAVLSDIVKTRKVAVAGYIELIIVISLCLGNCMMLTSSDYLVPYDSNADDIQDAIEHVDWENVSSYSGFEYYVYYDKIVCDKLTLAYNEECADILFVAKDEINIANTQGMVAVYENDSYIVYQRL